MKCSRSIQSYNHDVEQQFLFIFVRLLDNIVFSSVSVFSLCVQSQTKQKTLFSTKTSKFAETKRRRGECYEDIINQF